MRLPLDEKEYITNSALIERMNDELIVEGLQSLDRQKEETALRQLYQEKYGQIADFVIKNNGSTDDAADVFQDAVIVFYRNIRQPAFQLTCSIQTYLFAIAKRLWYNRLKKNGRIIEMTAELTDQSIALNGLQILEQSERQQAVTEAVRLLGNACQQVLTYYYFERMRMREIALRMNYQNEQVAKNKKAKCMKKLRALVRQSAIFVDTIR